MQLEGTRRYSKEQWEAQKPIIVGMYPLKGMTLEKIADFLLKERNFPAT
jgi:Clr5 domain